MTSRNQKWSESIWMESRQKESDLRMLLWRLSELHLQMDMWTIKSWSLSDLESQNWAQITESESMLWQQRQLVCLLSGKQMRRFRNSMRSTEEAKDTKNWIQEQWLTMMEWFMSIWVRSNQWSRCRSIRAMSIRSMK